MAKYILHDDGRLDQIGKPGFTFPQEKIIEETPTLDEILDAPEDTWRHLCALADANPATIERMRVHKRLVESGQVKPKRKRSRRRSRPSTSTRRWTAASVLQSQARVGAAMVESVDRVNSGELDGGESRTILVTCGDECVVMEVVA